MTDASEDKRERARSLTEDAVAEYARGDRVRGDQLAGQAVKTDRDTVKQVIQETMMAGTAATPT